MNLYFCDQQLHIVKLLIKKVQISKTNLWLWRLSSFFITFVSTIVADLRGEARKAPKELDLKLFKFTYGEFIPRMARTIQTWEGLKTWKQWQNCPPYPRNFRSLVPKIDPVVCIYLLLWVHNVNLLIRYTSLQCNMKIPFIGESCKRWHCTKTEISPWSHWRAKTITDGALVTQPRRAWVTDDCSCHVTWVTITIDYSIESGDENEFSYVY